MKIERSRHLNAQPYERTNERTDYANGFKPKKLKTRIGSLELQVPQVKEEEFYPSFCNYSATSRHPGCKCGQARPVSQHHVIPDASAGEHIRDLLFLDPGH